MLLTYVLVLTPRVLTLNLRIDTHVNYARTTSKLLALNAFNVLTCPTASNSFNKFAFLIIDTHVNYARTTSKLLALNAFNVLTCTTASNSFKKFAFFDNIHTCKLRAHYM